MRPSRGRRTPGILGNVFGKGVVVVHLKRPEWGPGVITGTDGDKYVVEFESHEPIRMKIATMKDFFEVVPPGGLPADSPLLDEKRWLELNAPAPKAKGSKAKGSKAAKAPAAPCQHCGQPLNRAQFRKNGTLKSCPKCSQNDGVHHVYHPYPEAFGVSSARSNDINPEGPQSYCSACRRGTDSEPGTECQAVPAEA